MLLIHLDLGFFHGQSENTKGKWNSDSTQKLWEKKEPIHKQTNSFTAVIQSESFFAESQVPRKVFAEPSSLCENRNASICPNNADDS